MTSAKTTTSPGSRPKNDRSGRDSARWIGGLILLFAGIFVAASLFFSFFSWSADQSGLALSDEERTMLGVEPENLCGWTGARLGYWLVDSSLGLFGLLVPVMAVLVGVRIIRQRSLLFNHSILSLSLVTLLGSLTLGFVFGDRWSLICSTGWGGAFGIGTAALLRMHIGVVGTVILLLGGWILTGVFINRNFINTVNTAGNVMVDRSERIVESVRRKVAPHAADGDSPLAEAIRRSVRPEPASGPASAPKPDAPAGAEEAPAAQPSDAGEVPVTIRRTAGMPDPPAADTSGDDENPFLEIPLGVRSEDLSERVPAAETPAETLATPIPAADSSDGIFTEVDLSRPAGRVVMGRGGLVELDAPAVRDDALLAGGTQTAPAGCEEPLSEGPFTEITVPPAASAPEPSSEPVPATPPALAGEPQPPASEGVVVTVEAREARLVDERAISTESYDPLKDLVNYRKPPVTLLEDYPSDSEVSDEEIYENKSRIEETLKYFGIPIRRIKATVGPTVTLYEIVQAQGVKISKIQGLENDIAQSLKALGIRIIAPIPGKGTIGIEVPNRDKQVVSMYSSVRSLRFQESKAELPVVIGRTIQNENYVFDLAKMPHLLVAGATGQGKSVGLNAIITSLLYRKHPAQLKFVMIDPKMVEFSLYAKIERHFLAKMESEEEAIITDPKKAVYTLNALCLEMDNRLELCKKAGARNIAEYNAKFTARRLNPQHGHRYLPYIVVVVDEFADLIMTAREVEGPVMRLAQKARAIGIHLIIATQRPDVKVITGGIKANFPARIAFRVMQMIDSRTIIDQPGANQLIGRGDMLFSKDGELTRIQCALVETREVERIVDYIAGQQGYTAPYALPDYTPESGEGGLGSEESSAPVKYDSLFAEIAREAVSGGQISTSMIQRNYEVGFNRAGRIMMQLERAGIVGRQQGAKPRDILFHDLPSLEARLQDLGLF